MQMKTGVEQGVYAILMLTFLPEKAVLPGEVISSQLGGSPTYFQKILRHLVNADLISSVPGKKGGFKLKQQASDIRIYDVYLAIEGKQSLYSSTGLFQDLLNIKDKEVDMLSNLMDEAEDSWQSILKRETIGSLQEEIMKKCPPKSLEQLRTSIYEKMVL